ncbi:hypothetical protein Tco_0236068 [Tanacetum coccineum]
MLAIPSFLIKVVIKGSNIQGTKMSLLGNKNFVLAEMEAFRSNRMISGSARSKLWLPPLLLKLNMWLMLVVVDNIVREEAEVTVLRKLVLTYILGLCINMILMNLQFSSLCLDTKIPQSSGPPIKVGDEAVHKELGDRMERAATTASSLEAEQDSDAQTRFETTLKKSNNPPLKRLQTWKWGGEKQEGVISDVSRFVLDLEKAKDAQAKEIAGLKKRVQKLERKKKSRTTGLKRLRKVGESRRVSSSEDKESLGAQEDASKLGRIFKDFDKDAEVSLVDETQGRSDDAKMFDTDDLHGDEVIVDMAVGEKQEQSAKVDEREVSTGVEDSAAPTILVYYAWKRSLQRY